MARIKIAEFHISDYVQGGKLVPLVPDMVKLDRKQLSEIAKYIFGNANKRAERIRKAGLESFSVELIDRIYGGKFSAKGLTNQQLINAIQDANNFLKQNDFTVKGARQYTKDMRLAEKGLTAGEKIIAREVWNSLKANGDSVYETIKRKSNYYADSDRLNQHIQARIVSYRRIIPGGIGGDAIPTTKAELAQFKAYYQPSLVEDLKQSFIRQFAPLEYRATYDRQRKIGGFSMTYDAAKTIPVEIEDI